MENNKFESKCENEVKIPEGSFSSGNCVGCIYWNPHDSDSNGRQWCNWYDTYYYPRERNGCLSREEEG